VSCWPWVGKGILNSFPWDQIWTKQGVACGGGFAFAPVSSTLAHLAHYMESPIVGSLSLRWKVLHVLENAREVQHKSMVFNIAPNPGVFSQFGVSPDQSYVPQVLQPTIVYHQAIRRLLKQRAAIRLDQVRFPYRLEVPKLKTDISFTLQARLYQPNILSLTIAFSSVPVSTSAGTLIGIQDLHDLKPVSDIVRWTIGMVETLSQDPGGQDRGYRAKPLVRLQVNVSPDRFQTEIDHYLPEYVGILIRNRGYERMQPEIVTRLLEKNAEFNVKSSDELLLIDKQGILFVSGETSPVPDRETPRRLSKVHDLTELALVFGSFLDRFRSLRSRKEPLADFLLHKISPWILNPDATLANSVTNRQMWRLFLLEFGLTEKLTVATRDLPASFEHNRPYVDLLEHEWWKRDDVGLFLSDGFAGFRGVPLVFIKDNELRKLIIADYEEARRSLTARNYKSTILLCGSSIEALLTSVVLDSNIPGLNREKLLQSFTLAALIELAQKHNIIAEKTLLLHLESLRLYRNMIHPGVQIRKSIDPDESRARIALETVNLLIRELNRWANTAAPAVNA
jgi:hypothetical protein